jgi:hypothetical protein
MPVADGIDGTDVEIDSLKQAMNGEEITQDNTEDDAEKTQTTEPESDGSEESDDYVWKFADNEYQDKLLVDLYVLADKLMDPVTANMAIDKLIRMTEARHDYPSPNLVSYVYRFTTVGSQLRRLCRDWYVFTVSESWVDTIHQDGYPHAFLRDLLYEICNLQRDNKGKRVRNVFSAQKLADLRTTHYYHQKVEKVPDEPAMPEHHQKG